MSSAHTRPVRGPPLTPQWKTAPLRYLPPASCSFFLFSVHVCVCVRCSCIGVVYVQVCPHMCLDRCASLEGKGGPWVFPALAFYLIALMAWFLTEPGANHNDPLASTQPMLAPALGLQVSVWPHPTFYMGAVHLNPGPHVCTFALTH